VAAALIIGETWRSSRVQSKRRYNVDEQLDILGTKLQELTSRVEDFAVQWEQRLQEEKKRCVFLFPLYVIFDLAQLLSEMMSFHGY
jgi:hypothetical protein